MEHTFTTLLTDLHTSYPHLKILLLGDFQHTIMHNNLHRMGKHLPAPPADILGLCLRSPFFLVSVIPHCHPEQTYHTWISNSGSGRAGLDHILAVSKDVDDDCICGIDLEIAPSQLKSDHYLVHASFYLSYPNTAPTPTSYKQFHYRRVAQIPLIKTYPKNFKYNAPQ